MNDLCPCCFRELPDGGDLVIDLDANFLIYNGYCIELTGTEAEVLYVLRKAAPRWVSIDALMMGVYGYLDGAPCSSSLRNHISNIRRKVASLPITLEVSGRQGAGKNYRLIYR